MQARRQEYSAKIALMTAKLQALSSPSSVVFLCFTQDTDGKLDLSTELARERKAQIADLQRQNKARASDCLLISQLTFFSGLGEQTERCPTAGCAACMFLTFKRHNCTLLLQGSCRIADRWHGGAQTAFQEGQGGHLFSSLLRLPILKLRRLSSRAPTDAVALAKKHDVSSRRVWHACAFDGLCVDMLELLLTSADLQAPSQERLRHRSSCRLRRRSGSVTGSRNGSVAGAAPSQEQLQAPSQERLRHRSSCRLRRRSGSVTGARNGSVAGARNGSVTGAVARC